MYGLSNQIVLVRRAIYMLIWRVLPGDVGTDREAFERQLSGMVVTWMRAIQLRAPGASILLVATHIDCAEPKEVDGQCKFVKHLVETKLKQLQQEETTTGILAPTVRRGGDSLRVNCLMGEGIDKLKEELIDSAYSHPYFREAMPSSFLKLKDRLDELLEGSKKCLTLAEFSQEARVCGVQTGHFGLVINFFHDQALIKYFGIYPTSESGWTEGADVVYIDTNWMIDVIKGVVRHNRSALLNFFGSGAWQRESGCSADVRTELLRHIKGLTTSGIVSRELFPFLWPYGSTALSKAFWEWTRAQDPDEKDIWPRSVATSDDDTQSAVSLLQGLEVLTPINQHGTADKYLVPALLSATQHSRLDVHALAQKRHLLESGIVIPDIPDGFLSKLIVRMQRDHSHVYFSGSTALFFGLGNTAIVSLAQDRLGESLNFGLKWEGIGSEKPSRGNELHEETLASGLQGKQEFSKEEWDKFKVAHLTSDSYIKVGDNYFKPAGASDTERTGVKLSFLTSTQRQMDQIQGHLDMLLKFYPGMLQIHQTKGPLRGLQLTMPKAPKAKIIHVRIIGAAESKETQKAIENAIEHDCEKLGLNVKGGKNAGEKLDGRWDGQYFERIRVVVVCVDEHISKDGLVKQRCLAAAKAGLPMLPLTLPGYDAAGLSKTMPELQLQDSVDCRRITAGTLTDSDQKKLLRKLYDCLNQWQDKSIDLDEFTAVAPSVLLSFCKSSATTRTQDLVNVLRKKFDQDAGAFLVDVGEGKVSHEDMLQCTCVVILLNDGYIQSEQCAAEFLLATRYSKFLIPVLVDGWTGPNDKDYWKHAKKEINGQRVSWFPLSQFEPIDRRPQTDEQGSPGPAEIETVKRVQARLHRGNHVQHSSCSSESIEELLERLEKLRDELVENVSDLGDNLADIQPGKQVLMLKGEALERLAENPNFGRMTSHEILDLLQTAYKKTGGKQDQQGNWKDGLAQVHLMKELGMFEYEDFEVVSLDEHALATFEYNAVSYTWSDSQWREIVRALKKQHPKALKRLIWIDVICLVRV